MQDKNYILLYSDRKIEDTICTKNMFGNNEKIYLGWTSTDNTNNMKIIDKHIKKDVKNLIFLGMEIGWDELIKNIREKYADIKIKVICTTMDSLLYNDYERENFFKMLEMSRKGYIHVIAFLRKGQYETYNSLGYSCVYLLENYIEKNKFVKSEENSDGETKIGIYQLDYTWNKNIFNQFCVGKFIDNSIVNYNLLNERMSDFLQTMNIKNCSVKIDPVTSENLKKELIKNTINISCSFTEYMHPIFFISMENNIPCITGDNLDLFENNEYLKKLVCNSEDNPIKIKNAIEEVLKSKDKIFEEYDIWKNQYNEKSANSINEFLNK